VGCYVWKHEVKRKGKCKFQSRKWHGCPEGERIIAILFFLTSAIDGGGWLKPRPGRFGPREILINSVKIAKNSNILAYSVN
jgi:hypothetical protein